MKFIIMLSWHAIKIVIIMVSKDCIIVHFTSSQNKKWVIPKSIHFSKRFIMICLKVFVNSWVLFSV